MRKKALLAQNISLFEQLEQLRGQNALKDKRIKELEDKVNALSSEKKKEQTVSTEPLERLKEKVENNKKLQPEFEYASEVIGKLVIEAANCSNKLTSGGNTDHRELVNLLLGKTEVAKAEILAAATGEGDLEAKNAKADAICEETLDYYRSVLAQIDPS
ncbi:MAG: hypothetical protein IKZ47_00210 [Clostridia bacterium]|nr:hypothetical protein [Clostridia bacterium]